MSNRKRRTRGLRSMRVRRRRLLSIRNKGVFFVGGGTEEDGLEIVGVMGCTAML